MASFPETPLLFVVAVVLFKMGEVVERTFCVEVGNCCRRDEEDWKDAMIILLFSIALSLSLQRMTLRGI